MKVLQREVSALTLRMEGKTFEEIAAALGYANRSCAYAAVMAALERNIDEPTAEMRNLELKRLDKMLAGLWPSASKGNGLAVDRALKIMARRARLMGLDIEGSDDRPEVHRFIVEVSERNGGNGGSPTPDPD